jgi:hypothetical protein
MNRIFLVVLILIASGIASAEDFYVEMSGKSIGRGSDQSWVTKMWVSENYIRTEEPEGNTISIMDFENRQLITLDSKAKQYFIIPMSQISQDFRRASQGMQSRMKMNWRIEEGTKEQDFVGFPCRMVRFHGVGTLNDGRSEKELRVTMTFWINDQLARENSSPGKLLEIMGLDANPFVTTDVMNELRKSGGFFLYSETESVMGDDRQGVVQEVTKVVRGEAPSSAFSIPVDYQRVQPPEQQQQ